MYNRFSYVGNNPINFNDPSGHVICEAEGSFCFDPQMHTSTGSLVGNGCNGCWSLLEPEDEEIEPLIVTSQSDIEFQMILITDPYYYGNNAQEGYTDHSYGGIQGNSRIGNFFNRLGLLNDFLIGISPSIIRARSPYDQVLTVNYEISYQGVPRINATQGTNITSMQISNNSNSINSLINYTVSISTSNANIVSKGSAAPGATTEIKIPVIPVYAGGVDIRVVAYTGCNQSCIYSPNLPNFVGHSSFVFHP